MRHVRYERSHVSCAVFASHGMVEVYPVVALQVSAKLALVLESLDEQR